MSEKNRSLLSIIGIVLLFVLLLIVIWLVYDYQLQKLDNAAAKTLGSGISFPTIKIVL